MEKNKENVPKIRFPGFTGPWEQRKLGKEFYKVNERNDGSFGKEHWISVAKMYFQDPEKVQSNNIDTRTYVMRFGDIAFEGHPNQEFKFGRFVANDIGEGVVSELFPIYRHKQEYDNDFWKRAIQLERIMAPIFAKAITSSGNSSNKLDEKHFLRECIPVPAISEQKQIGTFFRQLDKLITLHQRKLEHLQDKKKGLLQKMFPKEGEKFPEIRFPGFDDPWEQRKLGEVVNFKQGIQVDLDNQYTEKSASTVRFIRIVDYTQQTEDIRYIENKNDINLIDEEDMVMVRYGATAGFVGHGISGAIANNMFTISPCSNITKSYLYTFLKMDKLYLLLNNSNGSSAMPALNFGIVADVEISYPKVEEQEKIAAFFEELDNLITLHKRKLEHLQQQKKGLLQQMFI